MWEPRRLTTLWAFTACYRNSFTFLPFVQPSNVFVSHEVFKALPLLMQQSPAFVLEVRVEFPLSSFEIFVKWYWRTFLSTVFGFLLPIVISSVFLSLIYHPGLVHRAYFWPQHQETSLTGLQEQKKIIWSREPFLFLMSGPTHPLLFYLYKNVRLTESFIKLLLA
jgi:hypothetical protein